MAKRSHQVVEPGRPTVLIVGGGAGGTLTAIHLLRTAGRRSTGLDVLLLDPAPRCGLGTAFGTTDPEHLLNVPASGMSALPESPSHFVSWLANRDGLAGYSPVAVDAAAFMPRADFAAYLDDTLSEAAAAASGLVSFRHLRTSAVSLGRQTGGGLSVATSDGRALAADAVVVATGAEHKGNRWAPEDLQRSAFFVDDPWLPGALDVVRRDHAGHPDVLVVGTGLTMVDVVRSLSAADNREGRSLVAVSRSGALPRSHARELKLAAIPEISDWGSDLPALRDHVAQHLRSVARTTGDWRPALDGLRFRVSALWARLDEEARSEFLSRDARTWNLLRHRMAPSSAALVRGLQSSGRLQVLAAEVSGAEPLPLGGLRVALSDGSSRDVGWVVNCTGPESDVRRSDNPLLRDLLRSRAGSALATPATAGMGFATVDGRLLDAAGTTEAPLWTLGALRRGELWESTAVPEIRSQALALSTAVLDSVAPLPRRLADGRLVSGHHPAARPRDPLGLPLSTNSDAADVFNAGLQRLMTLQDGAEELLRESVSIDPGFAVGHAALAMLGHEAGAGTDVAASLASARDAVRRRGDAREASLVDVVARRVHDVRGAGSQALMSHIASYPRDVLAVSAAVPTIAFSGVTDVQQEAWDLVEGLAPAYGDHWWYISLLAFTRQDQDRFEEAGLLAESALSCAPSSGHAVHALTHVMYETGQHEPGLAWLDHWVAESGRSASHRAHFSWHAALHELALGDTEAVRQRYYSQLAPPGVTGVRALVDSASLLWRWRVTTSQWDDAAGRVAAPAFAGEAPPPPVQPVLDAVDDAMLLTPQTPFVAMHAALSLASADDPRQLHELRRHCAQSADPALRSVVVALCDALTALMEEQWSQAATILADTLPLLVRVGGSAAQRDVVEETYLFALAHADEAERLGRLLDVRLDRRPSPLDRRRRSALQPTVGQSIGRSSSA